MLKKEKIQKWKEKVFELNKKTFNKSDKNLCDGFYSIDGELNPNADIIIIGFNPGKPGNNRKYEHFETIDLDKLPMSYLELNQGYRYHLAEKTTNVFKKAGIQNIEKHYENNCIKTNLYHLISENGDSLKRSLLLKEWEIYRDKMHNYIYDLIDVIQPKLVLIEGKITWEKLIIDTYETYNRSWNNRYHFGYFYHKETEFVGYNRNQNTDDAAIIVGEIFNQRITKDI